MSNKNGDGTKCPPHNYEVDHIDQNINPDTGNANPVEYSVCSKCGDVKSRGL